MTYGTKSSDGHPVWDKGLLIQVPLKVEAVEFRADLKLDGAGGGESWSHSLEKFMLWKVIFNVFHMNHEKHETFGVYHNSQ